MKEDKFRVWNGSEYEYNIMTGKFGTFYVNPDNNGIDEHDSACLSPLNTKIEGAELEQYTGLLDKNGKEIWEGDVVESVNWNEFFSNESGLIKEFKRQFEIVFHDAAFCLREIKTNVYFPMDNGNVIIIGNIHETPDLLK